MNVPTKMRRRTIVTLLKKERLHSQDSDCVDGFEYSGDE
jgi:hypothetical protein